MAKYVIEIEKMPFRQADSITTKFGNELYRVKGFNALVFDQNGLDKLTPYTEPDRKAIENEVWKFAKIFMDDMGVDDLDVVNGDTIKRYFAMTYQEAKARYESWKAKREQIRVGDEVEYFCGGNIRFVVCGIHNDVAYGFKCRPDFEDLEIGEYCDIDELKKTGRHFDYVEKLLEEMRSDS